MGYMPTVALRTSDQQEVFLSHEHYKKHYFIAMGYVAELENHTRVVEYEEFTWCKDVQN